jgi:hypothetical protein
VGKVFLRIMPPPARIRFEPPLLDFGAIFLGTTNRLAFRIFNASGGAASGRLVLPKGFSLPAGGEFSLPVGGSVQLQVEFSPPEPKDYSARAVCSPPPDRDGLLLKGSGRNRFEAVESFPGILSIRNLTAFPLPIFFSGGRGWVLPPDLKLGPQESRSLALEPDRSAARARTVAVPMRVSDGLGSVSLTPSRPEGPVPLMVERQTPESLGSPRVGETVAVTARVLNRSPYTKTLRFDPTASSGIIPSGERFLSLKPMESRDVRVLWIPSVAGKAQLEVLFKSEGMTTNLCWTATPLSPPSPQAASVVPAATEFSPSADPIPQATPEESVPETQGDDSSGVGVPYPTVDGLCQEVFRPWFRRPIIRLLLPAQPPSMSYLVVESRAVLSPEYRPGDPSPNDSSPIRLVDVPVRSRQTSVEHGIVEILIPDASPGWHLLRVTLQPKQDGAAVSALSQIQVFVPEGAAWLPVLKVLFTVAAVLGWIIHLLRRRSRAGRRR